MERASEGRQAAALALRMGHGGGTPPLLECGGSPPPGAGAGLPAVARSIQGLPLNCQCVRNARGKRQRVTALAQSGISLQQRVYKPTRCRYSSPMVKPVPKLSIVEIARLIAQAGKVPAPASVRVERMEDQYGDEALRLVVVFPANLPVEKAMWNDVKPLVEKLRDFVYSKDNEDRFVYLKIIRLAEEPVAAE